MKTLILALLLGAATLLSTSWQSAPTAPGSSAPASAATERARTVIVVRHAEKDAAGDARDPALGERGRARAAALAKLLARSGARHFFASEFQRTQQTLAPLAEALGGRVEVVPAKDASALAKKLRELEPGSVSVVAGHSNTVPALVHALGGEIGAGNVASLGEDEYGRLFVVTLAHAGEPASVLELAYGD